MSKPRSELARALKPLGYDDSLVAGMTDDEVECALVVFREQAASGRSAALAGMIAADYREQPVDIDTFIEDPRYVGTHTKSGESIYPKWREVLREIHNSPTYIREVIFTGSIGTGKTSIAVLSMVYDTYRLSCLKDPQAFYGLVRRSMIALGLYNVFKYKVGTTSFPIFKEYVDASPYFREHFERDPNRETSLKFPQNVIVISGSSEIHALGDNLYSVLIDEANFMRGGTKNSGETIDQATALYQSTLRRMESRFAQPGRLYLVSSKKHQSSYTTQHIREVRSRSDVYVADYPFWEVKPKSFYYGWDDRRFKVLVGNSMTQSRILGSEESVPVGMTVIDVPEKHKDAFEMDVESALRDIAGVETYGTMPLIANRDRVSSAFDKDRKHPFTTTTLKLGIDMEETIEDFLKHSDILNVKDSRYRPKLNPEAPRFIHVDLAMTGDCAGFAMGHISGKREVKRLREDGSAYIASAPIITIDLMLQIKAPTGSEIDISKIRAFPVALSQYGFSIHRISFDGWQSGEPTQILKKEGYDAVLLSVDRTDEAYTYVRQAHVEDRIRLYFYQPYLDELVNLIWYRDKKKVDHPDKMTTASGAIARGSKDVTDSVAGVVYHCMYADMRDVSAPAESAREDSVPLAPGLMRVHPREVGDATSTGWVANDYRDIGRVSGIEGNPLRGQ